jgi:regulator of sigma E protease
MLTSLLSFIFVLGLLIFVHELGHFATAKMVGIRVERFSLGFPPRMFGKKIGDTDYCISWLPLGGYVKMAGMVDESLDAEITGEPWEFQSKPVWQKVIVIAAGSFMNIVTAIVIYSLIIYFNGIGIPNGATVGDVLSEKPAAAIGMQKGDVITAIDNTGVSSWEGLTGIIHKSAGKELTIKWERNGELFEAKVTPELQEDRGLIGIAPEIIYRDAGLFESFEQGTVTSFNFLRLILGSLGQIITGEQPLRDAVGGPIMIAAVAGEMARRGFGDLLALTAFISLNLGFFNLLPFPVLDGGHLVFLGIEGIRRKPVSVKAKVAVQKVGMAFLLALMVFVIYNDFRRLSTIKDLFNF